MSGIVFVAFDGLVDDGGGRNFVVASESVDEENGEAFRGAAGVEELGVNALGVFCLDLRIFRYSYFDSYFSLSRLYYPYSYS